MIFLKKTKPCLLTFLILFVFTFSWGQTDQKVRYSREKAGAIVIEKMAESQKAPRGLKVFGFPDLLPAGSRVVPYDPWMKGKKDFMTCKEACWFFWIDDDPQAQFAHDTRYVLVNADSGEIMVKKARWWPVVRGKVMWGETAKRAKGEFMIFEKAPAIKIETAKRHIFEFPKPQAIPGCEEWVILVCGSTDIGNTFDEDVQFLYNVFTGLGIDDAHIFYVSPWTTDPGVDQTTTPANVQWAINQVAANADGEDQVFFFYSSHGDVDSLQCCPGEPGGGYVSATDMDNWLDTITCRQMTILLQGCRTGSFIGYYSSGTTVDAENELTGDGETNRIAITATDTDHSSYGGSSTWGSTFTGGYVESFNDPAADTDPDGAICVKEAYDYALAHDSAAVGGLSFPHLNTPALNPSMVFHACPPVDIWISDGPNDVGNNSHDYNSTDIWSSLTPSGTVHSDPVSGTWNYVHVRVHNLGSTDVNNVDVKLYWADTSVALAWPGDFNQIGTTYTIPTITAGGHEEHTWSWYVSPSIGTGHKFCFVATADCSADPMAAGLLGTYVAPYDNNIAQKNITIIESQAAQSVYLPFTIGNNTFDKVPVTLVIDASKFRRGTAILSVPDVIAAQITEKKAILHGLRLLESKRGGFQLQVVADRRAMIENIHMKPMEKQMVKLKVMMPKEAKIGEEFSLRVEEIAKGDIVGANNFVFRIVPPGDCNSIMREGLEFFAQLGFKLELDTANRIAEFIHKGLAEDLCRNDKAALKWKRKLFELEYRLGKELKEKVSPKRWEMYMKAVKNLDMSFESNDLAKVMMAQREVVNVVKKILAKSPKFRLIKRLK